MIERFGVKLNKIRKLPIIRLFEINGFAVYERSLFVFLRIEAVSEIEIVFA